MSLTIEYLGHSGFLLTGRDGSLAIDPFLTGNPLATRTHDTIKCGTVAITHGHGDHIGDSLTIARANGATVVANWEICEYFAEQGVTTDPGNPGGRVQTPFGWIAFTQAFHSSSYEGRYMGQPCGLIARFDAEDTTIFHLGDTGLFGDLKLIGEIYRPHIACIPVGDRFTMGPELGSIAAEMIRPRVAIPIHWKTFPMLAQDISAFRPNDIDVWPMAPGDIKSYG
jgi:L-ascorbate metabolism protein UlaG (beta-lactamase superfamily)